MSFRWTLARLLEPLPFVEMTTGLAIIGFGVWLLNPAVNTFERFASYLYMSRIANENIWGSMFVVAGIAQVIGVARNNKAVILSGATAVLFLRTFLFFGIGLSTGFASNALPDLFIWASLSAYIIFSHRVRRW